MVLYNSDQEVLLAITCNWTRLYEDLGKPFHLEVNWGIGVYCHPYKLLHSYWCWYNAVSIPYKFFQLIVWFELIILLLPDLRSFWSLFILKFSFHFDVCKGSIMETTLRCQSYSTKLFAKRVKVPFQFISNIWLTDLSMWVLTSDLLFSFSPDIYLNYLMLLSSKIDLNLVIWHRFFVIFLSSKVIVLLFRWERLNLLYLSFNGFAPVGCH